MRRRGRVGKMGVWGDRGRRRREVMGGGVGRGGMKGI